MSRPPISPPSQSPFVAIPLIGACIYLLYREAALTAVHYDPWAQFIYAGILLLYLCTAPSFHELFGTAFLGVCLTRFGGFTGTFAYPGGPFVTTTAYIGVTSILVLAWRAPKDANARKMLFRCLVLQGIGAGINVLLALNSHLAAWKLDAYLYVLDLKLMGFAPGFALAASRFESYLRPIELAIYYALPFVTIVVYAGHVRKDGPPTTNFALIATANLIVGYAAYLFYPAAGPVYAFGSVFPKLMPVLDGIHPQLVNAPANAMPSLHLSSALLIWWNTRPWRRARYFALAFLALTVLATFGLGEHYAIDLVVAVPYALLMQALGTRRSSRKTCLLAGLLMTVAWLALLRYGFSLLLASSLLLRIGAVLTVCIPLWLSNSLLRDPCPQLIGVQPECASNLPMLPWNRRLRDWFWRRRRCSERRSGWASGAVWR